jgi:hypothetical protein
MTPTAFDFRVRIPADARLLGAIRQLATHAAGYAQLNANSGEQLAGHVERATQAAMAASKVQSPLIEYRFTADPEALEVTFSCDVAASTPRPASTRNGSVTIDWTSEGSRHTCRIRQRLEGAEP